MKWVLSYRSSSIHNWQLQNQNTEAQLLYNKQNASLRISGNTKRVFFLEEYGIVPKKLQLKTEYGMVIGETALPNKITGGVFHLNERRYYYRVENGRIALFDRNKKPVAECVIELFRNVDRQEHLALVFCFAWLTQFDAATKEQLAVAAVAC